MTLDEAEALLCENNISYELHKFKNEAEYWHHTALFPYTKNAKPCKVIAAVIKSNNGKKNIELQFSLINDVFYFEELWFGEYCFEMFDCNEDMLAEELIRNISKIKQGNFIVIVLNDISIKRWIADACFDLCEDDDDFGKPGYQKALQRINKPKGLISKLLRLKKQYEIYDWNTYRCIIK